MKINVIMLQWSLGIRVNQFVDLKYNQFNQAECCSSFIMAV